MITKHERNVEFEKELKALLKKHNAEIEIHDNRDKFGLDQQTILVTMSTVYEPNGNKILKEYSEFDMGSWVSA
jgi:hypothetical protein